MLFSEFYKIEEFWDREWFNPILETDVPLFLDPYLIENSDIPEFVNARQKINKFFKEIIEKIIDYHSKNKKKEVMEIMKNVLIFPEVNELCLGYSIDTKGSGTASKFASDIYHAIIDYIEDLKMSIENFTHVEILTIFSKGISHDGISDIAANILKEELISYTQRICKTYHIPLKKLPVNHIRFNPADLLWDDGYSELPINPFTKEAILLVPRVFLRRSQTFSYSNFCRFLMNQEAEYLRRKMNITLNRQIDKTAIIKIIKENPNKLNNYLSSFYGEGKVKKDFYDYTKDKDFIYYPRDIVPKLLNLLGNVNFKDNYTNQELFDFVKDMVRHFKHIIEHKGGYKMLTNPKDNKPFKEDFIQDLFFLAISKTCEEHNVEVCRESKASNGRIEFKFSQGVKSRTHLEIKLASNDKLVLGYQKQLPEYMKGEKVSYGIYLAVYFNDREEALIKELKETKLDGSYTFSSIEIMEIDARDKPTPSKLV